VQRFARRAAGIGCAWLAQLAVALPLHAEVYVWTDAQGQVHMTDDLAQVPPAQRPRVRAAAEADAARAEPPAPPAAAAETGAAGAPHADPGGSPPAPADAKAKPKSDAKAKGGKPPARRHVIQLESGASELRVIAEVDGVRVPFILDTGAEICALPGWAAAEMNAVIDDGTPRVMVVGVSGKPMRVPEIEVGSVKLGDLVVEDVQMAVLSTMEEGLLGMPFLNRFRVTTDPQAGTITLEEIPPSELETTTVGGMNARAWREKFTRRRAELEHLQAQLDATPRQYTAQREQLVGRIAEVEAQLEALEDQATRAGVPQAWRE
jgi:clan AA aspartic protease (TIGR02281 family)